MLGGCVFWRLKTTATSDRYAFILILPAVYLSGYTGQHLCAGRNNFFCSRTIVVSFVICLSSLILCTCCIKALRVHSMQDFYIKVGETIAMDQKKHTSPVTLDFSKDNALRLFNYSKCKTIQEKSSVLSYDDFNQILNQKINNYSQVYDSVYITAIIAHDQEKVFDQNKFLIPMIKLFTNSKKNKEIHLFKHVSSHKKEKQQDYQIIWSEDMTNPIDHPEIITQGERKIVVPSKRIMKGWTINLSDGAEPGSFGVIELKQLAPNNNALHMSSENNITIYHNSLDQIKNEMELCISYQGLSESVFSVKAYYFDESKRYWVGSPELDTISVNAMKEKAVFRCRIIPQTNNNAYYFRIALSLQRGDVNIFRIVLRSLSETDTVHN